MLIKHWQRYNDGAEWEVEGWFKVGAGGRIGLPPASSLRDANLRKMPFRGVSLKTSFTKAKLGADCKQPKSFKTGTL